MLDFAAAVEQESRRFHRAIDAAELTRQVPSCPDWSVADLTWHLTKVQHFWSTIVEQLLEDPDAVPDLEHPGADGLAAESRSQSARLAEALRARSPSDECWSWHDGGNNVGWVRRRQAHEALIHRIDAELAAGSVDPVDEALAIDGVDEVLTVSIDATDLPDWARFDPIERTVELAVPSAERHWLCELGWFRGTSPASGTTYDEAALRLLPESNASPAATISGSGRALDLWLWGRGPSTDLEVTGSDDVVDFIRAAAAAATQ